MGEEGRWEERVKMLILRGSIISKLNVNLIFTYLR